MKNNIVQYNFMLLLCIIGLFIYDTAIYLFQKHDLSIFTLIMKFCMIILLMYIHKEHNNLKTLLTYNITLIFLILFYGMSLVWN